ncbi:MAG TPA: cytochrome c-type biogenesis CcmF C-terminal domain-containing protein [Candidatus Kapabacteria bacterium]|nr:cytochrome c-type biogenesis CcmF C-terminal domain-containing protein [Candidatus Kapabacteria bacterium]
MIGKILVYSIASFSILSTILFFLSDKKIELRKFASWCFYMTAVSVVATSVYLLYNILIHNFQFTYIWEYSSRELHEFLLVATFYSGQQGSFLLWLLIMTIVGLFVQQAAKKTNLEPYAMGFFAFVILFIAVILILKSPFDYVWETFAEENLKVGFIPPNGRGLNPILQNYWINIHPPILFTGYSLMTVPFVFALAALIKKEYKSWITIVTPWTLFGGAILGLGIMLGGFWAYETLGWGGFWAWDPVENSSLIPWIFVVTFVHTAIVQRRTNGLIKTNFILGILSFIFVLYATFLTRSGVLGDTSVHSFVTPGAIVYNMLIIFMVTFTLIAIVFVAWRFKDINQYLAKSTIKPMSKEYSLTLGSILLIALGIVVIIGTSWPIMAELFKQPKAAIDVSIYNRFGTYFAIVFLLLNGVSLYQRWQSSSTKDLVNKITIPLIASLVIAVILYFMGIQDFVYLTLTFSAIFALITNLELIIRKLIQNSRLSGAYVAHFGIALLVIGAVVSGAYSDSQHIVLKQKETKSAFGYDFTFEGRQRIEQHFSDREKYYFSVKIDKGGTSTVVKPIVYWSNFNDWQSPFLEPGIYAKLQKDIYVAPIAVETDFNMHRLSLMKGEEGVIPINKDIRFMIESLGMDEKAMMNDGRVVFITIIKTELNGLTSLDTISTRIDPNSWEGNFEDWKTLPQYGIDVNMIRIVRDMKDISHSKLEFYFKKSGEAMPKPTDVFTIDVTLKPFINLVWAGTLITAFGFIASFVRFNKKNSNKSNIAK